MDTSGVQLHSKSRVSFPYHDISVNISLPYFLIYVCHLICRLRGNSFSNSLASPPPPDMPPPPSRPHRHRVHNSSQASHHTLQRSLPQDHVSDHKRLTTGPLIGIVIGSILGLLCTMLALVLCLHKVHKGEDISANNANGHGRPAAVATNTGYSVSHIRLSILIC